MKFCILPEGISCPATMQATKRKTAVLVSDIVGNVYEVHKGHFTTDGEDQFTGCVSVCPNQ